MSRISNSWMDAFLLSESSLFIQKDRILMITCGQTDLIQAIPEILDIVGKANVARVVYERKYLVFPHLPLFDFQREAKGLGVYFHGKEDRVGPAEGDHVHLFHASRTGEIHRQDATLQILMNGIDPAVRDQFSVEKGGTAVQAATVMKLCLLYTDMEIDTCFFHPCGYSLNGIRKNRYYTIHVSPQPECSYASFESNTDLGGGPGVIEKVISIFKPRRFSVVVTLSGNCLIGSLLEAVGETMGGYHSRGKHEKVFGDGYRVTLFSYKKRSWKHSNIRTPN